MLGLEIGFYSRRSTLDILVLLQDIVGEWKSDQTGQSENKEREELAVVVVVVVGARHSEGCRPEMT